MNEFQEEFSNIEMDFQLNGKENVKKQIEMLKAFFLEESKIRNLINSHVKMIQSDLTMLDNAGLYKEIESILKIQTEKKKGKRWKAMGHLGKLEFNRKTKMIDFQKKTERRKQKKLSRYEEMGYTQQSAKYLDRMMDVRHKAKYKTSLNKLSESDASPSRKKSKFGSKEFKVEVAKLKDGYQNYSNKKINIDFLNRSRDRSFQGNSRYQGR